MASSALRWLFANGPRCSKTHVQDTINHLESAGADIDDQSAIETEARIVRDSLVLWFIQLTEEELGSAAFALTKSQLWWLKLTSHFFDAYVSYLQRRAVLRDSRVVTFRAPNRNGVFLSHSGTEKKGYARPFATYLKKYSKLDVFFDERSIEAAGDGEEMILHAAVSSPIVWCVVAPSFLKRKWPMVEFLIAWTRHKKREHGFSLVMDCLEPENVRATGLWKEKILKMATLKVSKARSFPQVYGGDMLMESYDERFKRLASVRLANGVTLVERSDQSIELTTNQEVIVHRSFPMASFKEHLSTASHVRILNTWIHHLDSFLNQLARGDVPRSKS